MASLAVNSNSGGDGNVYNDNVGTWATVKGLTTGTVTGGGDTVNVYASVLTTRSIGRIFLPFNTSALTSGAVISAATLQFNVTQIFGSNGTLHAVQTTQADPTSLAAGDFDNIAGSSSTMTSGGSVAVSSTGIKTITLDATGLTWISKTGYTLLALVEDRDLTNTDPSPNDYRFGVNTNEYATSGNRPLLTITYTVPSAGGFFAFM